MHTFSANQTHIIIFHESYYDVNYTCIMQVNIRLTYNITLFDGVPYISLFVYILLYVMFWYFVQHLNVCIHVVILVCYILANCTLY